MGGREREREKKDIWKGCWKFVLKKGIPKWILMLGYTFWEVSCLAWNEMVKKKKKKLRLRKCMYTYIQK